MTETKLTIEVVHNAAESRFEARVKGLLCVAVYRLSDGVMRMTHTEVPPMLEGRGIAAKLVAAEIARTRPLSVTMAERIESLREWARDRTARAD